MFYNKFKKFNQSGSIMLEVALALGIFALLSSAIMSLVLDGYNSSRLGIEQERATWLAQEGIEAVRSIRDRNWLEIIAGTYGLQQNVGGYWELSGSSDTTEKYTRTVVISQVSRDASGNIDSGTNYGTGSTMKVVSTVSWSFNPGSPAQSVVLTEYLTER